MVLLWVGYARHSSGRLARVPQTQEELVESIAEQAAAAQNGASEEQIPEAPPVPPLEGDGQLTLNLGTLARGPIEAEVSMISASRPLEGMLSPNEEAELLVSVVVQSYRYVPVRENGRVVRWKLRLQARPVGVTRLRQRSEASAER